MKIKDSLSETRYLYPNSRFSDEAYEVANQIAGISKGLSRNSDESSTTKTGRLYVRALEIAKEIKRQVDMRYLKANYREVNEALENSGYVIETYALMALFNLREFRNRAIDDLDWVIDRFI